MGATKWPKFCIYFIVCFAWTVAPGTSIARRRLDSDMNTDNRFFGIIIGSIVVIAIVIFIFSGGELGGKKTIESDDDLPPVTTTDK